MGSSGVWMNVVASGLSTILHLAICALFGLIAYFYVRPARPDVWPLVAGWAGVSALLTLLHIVANTMVPALVGSAGGPELMLGAMALTSSTFAILRAGTDCVLAYALVVWAKGRKTKPGG